MNLDWNQLSSEAREASQAWRYSHSSVAESQAGLTRHVFDGVMPSSEGLAALNTYHGIDAVKEVTDVMVHHAASAARLRHLAEIEKEAPLWEPAKLDPTVHYGFYRRWLLGLAERLDAYKPPFQNPLQACVTILAPVHEVLTAKLGAMPAGSFGQPRRETLWGTEYTLRERAPDLPAVTLFEDPYRMSSDLLLVFTDGSERAGACWTVHTVVSPWKDQFAAVEKFEVTDRSFFARVPLSW